MTVGQEELQVSFGKILNLSWLADGTLDINLCHHCVDVSEKMNVTCIVV